MLYVKQKIITYGNGGVSRADLQMALASRCEKSTKTKKEKSKMPQHAVDDFRAHRMIIISI